MDAGAVAGRGGGADMSSYAAYPAVRPLYSPGITAANPVGLLAITQAACLLGTVVLLFRPQTWFESLPPALAVWGTCLILLGLAVVGFLVARRTGQNPWLDPLSLVSMYVWFRYGWGALVVFYWDRFPWRAVPALRSRFEAFGMRSNLESSCQILLLFGLALFLGLSLPVGGITRLLPAARWPVDERKFRTNLVLYTPVALFITIVLRYALPVSVQHTVSTFGWVSSALIAVASYWLFSSAYPAERRRWRWFVVIAVGSAEIAGFRTGMVNEFVYPVVAAIWGYLLARWRLPWKTMALVLAPAMLLILPWLTIYKGVAPGARMPVGARLAATEERLHAINYRAAAELTLDRFVARAAGPPMLSVFTQYYPRAYPFLEGRTYWLELMSLVPRVLWPGKPEISPELNRYTAGVGMVRRGGNTSAVFDAPAEYWVNFGMFGVLLFSFLHGLYAKVLYDWLVVRSDYLIGGSIFAILISLNLDFYGVVEMITIHLHLVPVWLLVFYLLSRRRMA